MKKIYILAFSLMLAFSAFAENRGGLATFAIMNKDWPCSETIRAFEGVPEIRIAVLFNSFGNDWSCLSKIAEDPRPKFFEFHLINEPCHKNNRCFNYEFLYKTTLAQYKSKVRNADSAFISKLQSYAMPVKQFLDANPSVACGISPMLESRLSTGDFERMRSYLMPIFGHRCAWIWNPLDTKKYSSLYLKDFLLEGHGAEPDIVPHCIANFDGLDIDLASRPNKNGWPVKLIPQYLNIYSNCHAAFLWINEFNGIGSSFVDPRKRKNWPKRSHFTELNKLLRKEIPDGGGVVNPAPVTCKNPIKNADGIRKGFVWKQSEHGGSAVFLPIKYNNIKLATRQVVAKHNGRKIAVSFFKSIYTEDGSRRQYFRFKKNQKDFPYGTTIYFGSKACVFLRNPKIRND